MAGDGLYGLHIGFVTDTEDPEGLYRVQFEIPGLVENGSPWAWPLGGKGGSANRGHFGAPRVGAEIGIFFAQGNIDHPWYVGGHHGKPGGVSEVPEESESGNPNIEVIATETFRIVMDEREGQKVLQIINTKTDDRIEFNPETNSVAIIATTALTLQAEGIVNIQGSQVQINGRVVSPVQDPI